MSSITASTVDVPPAVSDARSVRLVKADELNELATTGRPQFDPMRDLTRNSYKAPQIDIQMAESEWVLSRAT